MKKNEDQIEKLWDTIKDEVAISIKTNEMAAKFLEKSILRFNSLSDALASRIASKVSNSDFTKNEIMEISKRQFSENPEISNSASKDLLAFYERDPACNFFYQPFLYYKGFIALQIYRIGRSLYYSNEIDLAYFLQMRSSEIFGVDIHPAAKIGSGVMIDHAHNIVIGETAIIGDQVSILHAVTLGGTGKSKGKRHPKIGDGVLIGAGAKILGDISIGNCSRIAAGSVVLKSVPPCKTVAGVPAKEVGDAGCPEPAKTMNQLLGKK
tara:strand:+ start:517 stop:1314 length:798 start_codon:yes stop_codon:yes gene_type:complete